MNKRAAKAIKIGTGILAGVATGIALMASANASDGALRTSADLDSPTQPTTSKSVVVEVVPDPVEVPAQGAQEGAEHGSGNQNDQPVVPPQDELPATPDEPEADEPAPPAPVNRATTMRRFVSAAPSYVANDDGSGTYTVVCTYNFDDGSSEHRLVGTAASAQLDQPTKTCPAI